MSFFKSITTKPWERKGVLGGLEPEGAFESANEKVALSIFLIVASVVFSLFTVGYILRMELPDGFQGGPLSPTPTLDLF